MGKHIQISLEGNTSVPNKKKALFQQKLQRLEKLKKEHSNLLAKIDTLRTLYDTHLKEDYDALHLLCEDFLIALDKSMQKKSFSQWHLDFMDYLFTEQLTLFMQAGYKPVKSQEAIDAYLARKEQEALEMQEMEEELDAIFDDFLDEEEKEAQKSEESIEDFFEQRQRVFEEFQKQQKEKEQVRKVETTDKEFQKLYRTLVKKSHPDLATSNEDREAREAQMKKLTEVWENRDYYQLLLLQHEIIPENNITSLLKTTQMDNVIASLTEQIDSLNDTIDEIKYLHPDTSFFYTNFNAKSKKGMLKKIEKYKDDMEYSMEEMESKIGQLKTVKSAKLFLLDEQDTLMMLENPFGYDWDNEPDFY